MRKISLTQEKYALVNDEDFEWLSQWKWYTKKDKKTFYATRGMFVNGKRCTILMHHIILGHPLKGLETDHKNGNGLDNRRENLRYVTHRQNCQNKRNGKKKTSQYPGVCWKKQPQKWIAEIQINGKRKYLGGFVNEYDAFEAYEQAINAIGEKVIDIF